MSALHQHYSAEWRSINQGRPHHWPWDLGEIPVQWSSRRTGILVFYWNSRALCGWDEHCGVQEGWLEIPTVSDLPEDMRENASLARRVKHLGYWVASRRPAIFVCASNAAQRRRIAMLVTRDFDRWWQLHKGSWERTYWRTRAHLPVDTPTAVSSAAGLVPRCRTERRRWRVKLQASPLGPYSRDDLNTPLCVAILSFTGLKGYRVVRATSCTACRSLDTCLGQWRKMIRLKRQAKERLLFSLLGVVTASCRSRNRILECLLGTRLDQNGSMERIFKACLTMQQALTWWRSQVGEFQRLRQLGQPRVHTTGIGESMEYYGLLSGGGDHDSSGDEASDARHRQIEQARSIV
jgi:hypothetical protein